MATPNNDKPNSRPKGSSGVHFRPTKEDRLPSIQEYIALRYLLKLIDEKQLKELEFKFSDLMSKLDLKHSALYKLKDRLFLTGNRSNLTLLKYIGKATYVLTKDGVEYAEKRCEVYEIERELNS